MSPLLPTAPKKYTEGQALVEYALILVLIVIALTAAVVATGPAVGNVFSNTVCNLVTDSAGCAATSIGSRGNESSFWATVTYVAQHPPTERAYPINTGAPTLPPPTAGPSPTATGLTPSATPSLTPTQPPSPTPTDFGFVAPFTDSINNPEWWRVDNSGWLGSDDWRGEYYNNITFSGSPTVLWNGQISPANKYRLAFDWQEGAPIGGYNFDNFSIRFTRRLHNPTGSNITVSYLYSADDNIRLCMDKAAGDCAAAGGTDIMGWSSYDLPKQEPNTATFTLTPGTHNLTVEYRDISGLAFIDFDLQVINANLPNDVNLTTGTPGSGNCPWNRTVGKKSNTSLYSWANTIESTYVAQLRCTLEFRGWVDVSALTTPQMAFYDVWSLTAGSSVTLQVAEYQPYSYDLGGNLIGGPNWGSATNYTLHSGATKNFNWTRSLITLPTVASRKITYRFVISTGASPSNFWYLDDIDIRTMTTKTFGVCTTSIATCGNYWDLESTAQKADFITTGRWDLTSAHTAEGSGLAWDARAGVTTNYQNFGEIQPHPSSISDYGAYRVHSLELNGLVDFSTSGINPGNGTGGAADYEGDLGYPNLTFYQAYYLDTGEVLRVEYTRDAVDATPDSWTQIAIIDATSAPASGNMQPVEVDLSTISNWKNQPFRLRFALYVDDNYDAPEGWFIDNIAIGRKGNMHFSTYPFCEYADFGASQWVMTGDWGIVSGGQGGSSMAFTDSPAGDYNYGYSSDMRLKNRIDFNDDTPENTVHNRNCESGASGAATKPMLTFWFRRELAGNHNFSVEISRPAAPSTSAIDWTPIWTYYEDAWTGTQYAWERVEINLQAAIENVTGQTWTALKTGGTAYDDDFYIRFNLDTSFASANADGIYLDNIFIKDYTETSFKLWPTTRNVSGIGTGNGTIYTDDFDTPSNWWDRWQRGGTWSGVAFDSHSGSVSMADSPGANVEYTGRTANYLEMTTYIDLRGTLTTDDPVLSFWQKHHLGDGAAAYVQVAVENTGQTTQSWYDWLYGWGSPTATGSYGNSWEPLNWNLRGYYYSGMMYEYLRNDAWTREVISLKDYADDPATSGVNEGKRLRLRFAFLIWGDITTPEDGWFIDDVQFELRNPVVYNLPLVDDTQTTSRWISEGNWGLAGDLSQGGTGSTDPYGTDPWIGYYFDCINWMNNPAATTMPVNGGDPTYCTPSEIGTFLDAVPRTSKASTQAWLDARPQWRDNTTRFLKNIEPTINHWFSWNHWPPGTPCDACAENTTHGSWYEYYTARWIRDITVSAGTLPITVIADDGVRVRYEKISGGGPVAPAGWNILEAWTATGTTTQYDRTVNLAAGTYRIVVEWFESMDYANIVVQLGSQRYSFSDSPRSNPLSPVVNSIAYSNTAMTLDGVINLAIPAGYTASTFKPRLEYYTYFDLDYSVYAVTEVSTNGIDWVTTSLSDNCPSGLDFWWNCHPYLWGFWQYLPADGAWLRRSHDLSSYIGQKIYLRFRLSTADAPADGWWISNITINY